MREPQWGTVSSNSRFQTVLSQQYSANLSVISCMPLSGDRRDVRGRRDWPRSVQPRDVLGHRPHRQHLELEDVRESGQA